MGNPELKPCPFCGNPAHWDAPKEYVTCSSHACEMTAWLTPEQWNRPSCPDCREKDERILAHVDLLKWLIRPNGPLYGANSEVMDYVNAVLGAPALPTPAKEPCAECGGSELRWKDCALGGGLPCPKCGPKEGA